MRPKFWFGVNDKSFDPAGAKRTWDDVQFLYYGAMHTGDYDAWSEGVAFAQAMAFDPAKDVRPPPVRRGTTFSVAVTSAPLSGTQQNARVRVISLGDGSDTTWPQTRDYDYQGGIFAAGQFSSQTREHWRITVPSNASIGRYRVRVEAPDRSLIGEEILFYVIHNPYTLVANNSVSKEELETYGYDEDEDGVDLSGAYGSDEDHVRDHFTALYDTGGLETRLLAPFRRTRSDLPYSMLDIAVSAAQGTTSEFETMRRLYRLVAQQFVYGNSGNATDISSAFLPGLTPENAYEAALLARTLDGHMGGVCFEYGSALTGLGRSIGVLSRAISVDGLGGWSNHIFAEAYTPDLPQHGGKVANTPSSANSDSDPWYEPSPSLFWIFDDPRASRGHDRSELHAPAAAKTMDHRFMIAIQLDADLRIPP